MDWEDIWQAVGVFVIVSIVVIAGCIVFSPKNVDYYYLSHGNNTQSASACVFAHWTWHSDEVSFCTDDYQKALEFTAKANATLGIKVKP